MMINGYAFKRLATKISCLLYVAIGVLLLTGCRYQDTASLETFDGSINWELHGVWLYADGSVEGKIDFSLNGTVPTEFEPQATVNMELDFLWPEVFPYRNEGGVSYTGAADIADRHDNQSIYHGNGWLYDTEINDSVGLSFTLCPQKEFVVIRMGNQPRYLVASTDPNADYSEIFAFYSQYVHIYEE